MTYASGHAEHRRFKRSADLKQDFFHLVAGTFFRREMTHVKQSDRLCKMCCEFMVLRCAVLCLGWSWVGDKQSSEWWKPEHVWLKACKSMLGGRVVVPFSSEAIEKKEKLSIAPSKIEIYSQQDAPLSVPATSFASCSSCLVQVLFFSTGWMEEGRRRSFRWTWSLQVLPSVNTVYLFQRPCWSAGVDQSFRSDCYGYLIP